MADREHIHHKLLQTGMSKKKVVLTLYFIQIIILVFLFLIVTQQLNIDLIGMVLFVALAAAGFRIFGYAEMLPSFREVSARLEKNRNTRYAQYLIKRFEKGDPAGRSPDDFRRQLYELAVRLELERVEIRCGGNPVDEVYSRNGQSTAGGDMSVLKVQVKDGEVYRGEIILEFDAGNPYAACFVDMMSAIKKRIAG